jgi:transposase
MRKLDWVGVDVSAKELAVAMERDGVLRAGEFRNDPGGHRKLCRFLTKGGRSARVCLEATGIYHLDLALALHRTPSIEVNVVNPAATRDFGRALLQRSKTDTTDAAVILEYAKRMPFEPWTPPAQEILDLQALSRRVTALTVTRVQERNRLHAAESRAELSEAIASDIEAHLEHLQQSMQRLEAEALGIIEQSPELRRLFAQLTSVSGIATTSGIRILAELAVLPPDMTARQWVAHAGLDPRHVESGTSVQKPTRISKKGNKHLRSALYMPALVAIQREPRVRAFYEKIIRAGKKPIQALVAVMRKLLHAIHGMFRSNTCFDGEKFYATRG